MAGIPHKDGPTAGFLLNSFRRRPTGRRFFDRTVLVQDDGSDSALLGYQSPRSGKTVTVAWCADAGEAELLCGALHDAGVPNAAVNQYTAALGPYSGGSQIEVQVPVEDRERAAEVLGLLFDRNDVDPDPEPADGSADFAIDEQGSRFPLVILAEFATAREMLHASAALGSARVRTYVPNLVARKRDVEAPPPVFRVRVAEADVPRAREVLAEAEDPDEPRCPKCASWRVHPAGGSLLAWVQNLFASKEVADGVQAMQCLRCGQRFAWGNPKGTFEVIAAPRPADEDGRGNYTGDVTG